MTTIVRYRVKAGEEKLNERLAHAVYAELHALDPEGFRYATFRLDDGRTFVHLAVTDGDDPDPIPLRSVATFRDFRDGLDERCEEGPDVRRAEVIGSFGLLD